LKKGNSYEKWLQKGYSCFANEGLEGIRAERLARELGLNKSGYYHYFGDYEIFLDALLQYHKEQIPIFLSDAVRITSIDPDLIQILLKHEQKVLFHWQLVRNRTVPACRLCFETTNLIIDAKVAPLFGKYVSLENNEALVLNFFTLMRDSFYARLTKEGFTEAALRDFFVEAKDLVAGFLAQKP
jgi:AcrR family transcriptional regulator